MRLQPGGSWTLPCFLPFDVFFWASIRYQQILKTHISQDILKYVKSKKAIILNNATISMKIAILQPIRERYHKYDLKEPNTNYLERIMKGSAFQSDRYYMCTSYTVPVWVSQCYNKLLRTT